MMETNSNQLILHPDRLLSTDTNVRSVARRLFKEVEYLPIVSPHGHTNPAWFANNKPFGNPSELFIIPDHYLLRMLYSQGISLEELGINSSEGSYIENDPLKIWRKFSEFQYLFRGTPSRIWLDHALYFVFGIRESLSPETSETIYNQIQHKLQQPEFLPRALFDRFQIETLTTTESPLDDLRHHKKIRNSGWKGNIITAFRPDEVVDPSAQNFTNNVEELGMLTHENCTTWNGYLKALASRREFFKSVGATSTDHGHPSAFTADIEKMECEKLFSKALHGDLKETEAELFRGQMLTEMAKMSLDDGLVMQLHPGSFRNHNKEIFQKFKSDMGADIPQSTNYVHGLRPLLNRFGNEKKLTLILFTLDESTYSRELAPLAGHYPCLKLGPAWWFFDSPDGMLRYRRMTTETAGFYNTVGFNDDTRAFLSIPARHDMARRVDCRYLAELVCEHRINENEASEVAVDLAYRLVKKAYRLMS